MRAAPGGAQGNGRAPVAQRCIHPGPVLDGEFREQEQPSIGGVRARGERIPLKDAQRPPHGAFGEIAPRTTLLSRTRGIRIRSSGTQRRPPPYLRLHEGGKIDPPPLRGEIHACTHLCCPSRMPKTQRRTDGQRRVLRGVHTVAPRLALTPGTIHQPRSQKARPAAE